MSAPRGWRSCASAADPPLRGANAATPQRLLALADAVREAARPARPPHRPGHSEGPAARMPKLSQAPHRCPNDAEMARRRWRRTRLGALPHEPARPGQ
ncbi:MAG: hypothetical protein R2734_05305 [Nocardioides sp.]